VFGRKILSGNAMDVLGRYASVKAADRTVPAERAAKKRMQRPKHWTEGAEMIGGKRGEASMTKLCGFDDPKYRDNPKMIAKYLNVAFATGDQVLATRAIGNMVRAQGVSRFSQKVGLRREGLYRSFSGNTGPGFDTVMKVLGALQIQMVAKPANTGRLKAKGK
jgi:probable addiction module antidote protein